MRPILRFICWFRGHEWFPGNDAYRRTDTEGGHVYCACWRCGKLKRIEGAP